MLIGVADRLNFYTYGRRCGLCCFWIEFVSWYRLCTTFGTSLKGATDLSAALAHKLSFCVPYHLILIVASIWRLLFFRLATAVLPQTFQASIACNLRKIVIAQPTAEDLASMALPLAALLCFWYSWLAVVMGNAVHHVLEHFQRPHGLKLPTFLPAFTELGEC